MYSSIVLQGTCASVVSQWRPDEYLLLSSVLLGLFVSYILLSIIRTSDESERESGMAAVSLRLFPFLSHGINIDLFLCELFLPTKDVL